jgi:EAL domain-containing protein (putative c-di-GMP-specific phosphodiesterase class I)
MSVNVSAVQLRQSDFVAELLAVLEQTAAPAAQLQLELTESTLLHDVQETIGKMEELKSHGIEFVLDDFGTGFSSLSYLKRLPLKHLKIDRSFVRDILLDPNDASIARTVITLAQCLNLGVVAEGVETVGQHEFLLANGCGLFQGYLFGPPDTEAALLKLLQSAGCSAAA